MNNLTSTQQWIIVAFIASAAFLAVTLFLQGDIQVFAYVIVSLFVAGFAILRETNKSKNS